MAHGDMLRRLQRAQAQLTAVNAAVLAAFTAQSGYEPDGHRSAMAWLVNRTKMSRGAAAGAVGWQRRLARHGVIAAAMATRKISESWGKDIAAWTDPLPPLERDQADEILLEAAVAGVPLEDLRALARSIWETWKAQHPDPDDGNGGSGDEDGFEDRRLRLGVTFGGAGKLTGDLTAGSAAKLQAVFDAVGKHLGPDDWRSVEQRQHDALDEALSRLIKSGLLPQSAGTDTLAQVIIPFPALRGMHGASPAEEQWIADNAGQPGWLTGIGAEAAACDATIVPVVTGTVDWQAVDAMAERVDRRARPGPRPRAMRLHLRRLHLHPARPAGRRGEGQAAAHLAGDGRRRDVRPCRAGRLPALPAAGRPVQQREPAARRRHAPDDIPDRLRRAVILRDKHCGWPGGCDVGPAGFRGPPPRPPGPRAAKPGSRTSGCIARSTTRCASTAAAGKSSCTPTAPAKPSPRGEKSSAATARQAIELRYERCPPSCDRGGSCPRGHRAGPSRVLHRRRAREGRTRCGQSRGLGHHR